MGIGNASTMISVRKSLMLSPRSLMSSVPHHSKYVAGAVQRAAKCVEQEKRNQKKKARFQRTTRTPTKADTISNGDLHLPTQNIRRKNNTKLSLMQPIDGICIKRNAH